MTPTQIITPETVAGLVLRVVVSVEESTNYVRIYSAKQVTVIHNTNLPEK